MSTSPNFMESKTVINFEDPQIYHDCVLVVGEKKFHVVTGTLSLWSEHFRGLFNGYFNEAAKDEIELKELDAELFEKFLGLLYHSQSVILIEDDIIPLIKLSYRFLAPMVLELCKNYICTNFEKLDDIKLQLFETACEYGIDGLKTKLTIYFQEDSVLNKFRLGRLFELANEFKMDELKNNTVSYMIKNINVENCSKYLDYCEQFDLPACKISISTAIEPWIWNTIPPRRIIELTKTAFKHDVVVLKERLRWCIFCLTLSRGKRFNRRKDDLAREATETTVNWFLLDNHEEIFALPSEISQFIIVSSFKDTL